MRKFSLSFVYHSMYIFIDIIKEKNNKKYVCYKLLPFTICRIIMKKLVIFHRSFIFYYLNILFSQYVMYRILTMYLIHNYWPLMMPLMMPLMIT